MNNTDIKFIVNFNRLDPTLIGKVANWCFPEWLNMLNKQNELYYYTDINALVNGILKDRNYLDLWASRYSHLNDPSEITATIKELQKEFPKENHWMLSNVARRIKDNHSISFSVYQDYLPMWKMYGDIGKGVMLTFDTKEIAKQWPGLLQPCIYKGTVEYKRTKERILNAQSHSELNELPADLQQTIKMWMLQLFVSIAKNEKYTYENEVRLIGLGNRFFGDAGRQQYRVSNNQIIPYVDVFFPSVALKGICLGPLASNKSNKQTLKEFLISKGYGKVEVSTSKIQYR